MTAAQPHPGWCDPANCRAYGHPDADPYHRSDPVLLLLDVGTVAGVFLAESRDHPGEPWIELVSVPNPLVGPIWQVEDPAVTGMVLPLDPAAGLAQALRQLLRAAVNS